MEKLFFHFLKLFNSEHSILHISCGSISSSIEMRDSFSSDYEEFCLLRCEAMNPGGKFTISSECSSKTWQHYNDIWLTSQYRAISSATQLSLN
jgi:hypothetical protein